NLLSHGSFTQVTSYRYRNRCDISIHVHIFEKEFGKHSVRAFPIRGPSYYNLDQAASLQTCSWTPPFPAALAPFRGKYEYRNQMIRVWLECLLRLSENWISL